MERVIIIGCGGAGKSTLARKLGEKTGLPVIHLDQIFWSPGNWEHLSREEFDALLLQELQQRLARQGIHARFGSDVAAEVLRRGQDRRYGARAIRRCIEQEIGSVLAQKMMAGELPEGELTAAMLFGIPVSMG